MMRCLLSIAILMASVLSFAQTRTLYIGTYTGTGSKGIYVYEFNTKTGEIQWRNNTDSNTVTHPSYLALAPNGKYLYAVNETGGNDPGSLSSFALENGRIQLLNKVPTGGAHPCYVAINKKGTWALAGNYSGGSLSAFRINGDGTLQESSQFIQHEGKGSNTTRQEKAHVHATVFDPANQHVFVPDLGTDKVNIYRFKEQASKPLQQGTQPFAASMPGSGPRHFTFHPNGRFAYLMEELSGTVSAFRYKKGKLFSLQRISTHLPDFTGTKGSADIHISDDGKFLYASNRGDANTITTFSIAANGKLKWVDHVSSGGRTPRNFAIAPGGRFVLVANQETNNIVVFKRDAASGKLTTTGQEITIPKPVCLIFDTNNR